MSDSFTFNSIAIARSPYKEKFGIPRQPGLAQSLITDIELLPEYSSEEIIRGLEDCSHIWLMFVFSECVDKGWTPTVRPPRLGGNKRLGLLASRSPFRPNPIGLSPVQLLQIDRQGARIRLRVSGADLLDGTPIIDIKPYLPYSDIIPEATFGLASAAEQLVQEVRFAPECTQALIQAEQRLQQPVKQQIMELLRNDPRPAYKKNDPKKSYGMKLHDLNLRFCITDTEICVQEITPAG